MTRHRPAYRRLALPALILAVAALGAAGGWFYRSQHTLQRRSVEANLRAVARLKVRQIAAWRAERRADAAVLMQRQNLVAAVAGYLTHPTPGARSRIVRQCWPIKEQYHFADILVADKQHRIVLSLDRSNTTRHEEFFPAMERAIAEQRPVWTAFHVEPDYPAPHISVVAPLFSPDGGGSCVAAAVLVCDATQFLYPLIQSWPTASTTAETLLVSRDGDDVLFLNELRHRKNTALKLRIPLNRTDLPAAMAIGGTTGIVEGLDYRGVRVIAALLPVPESPWFMVCKMDMAEAFAAWRFRSLMILAVIICGAGLIVGTGLVLRQRDLKAHYRMRYESEAALNHVRRRHRQQLAESEERYRLLADNTLDVIWVMNMDLVFTYVNPAIRQLTGHTPGEWIGSRLPDHCDEGGVTEFVRIIGTAAAGQESRSGVIFELMLLDKKGAAVPVEVHGKVIRGPDGRPVMYQGVARDISERRKAQEKLDEIRGLLQAAMECSHAGIAIADAPGGKLRYVNDAGLLIRGGDWHDAVDGIGTDRYVDSWQLFDLDGTPLCTEEVPLARAVMFGETCEREFVIHRAPDDHRTVLANAAPVTNPRGEIVAGIVVFLDITARKRAEQRIGHLNRVLRAIRDINQLIVREHDPDALIHEACRLIVANRGYASALIVRVDADGRPIAWAASGIAEDSGMLGTLAEDGDLPPCCRPSRPNGVVVSIEERATRCEACPHVEVCRDNLSLCARLAHDDAVLGYLVVVHDARMTIDDEESGLLAEMVGDLAYALSFLKIEENHRASERRREALEHQLHQAQRLESVGRLAGGVAHDFNNKLNIIIGNAELALEAVAEDDPLHAELTEILTAARHSTGITRQLLAFSRQQTIAPVMLDLNDTIEGMLKMLRWLIGEDIDLVWRPQAEIWQVKMDPSQVDQIVANLCVNARDAVADVGRITIETRNVRLDENRSRRPHGSRPGDYVLLTVGDDGCGMDRETLENAFEPFFTTKGFGKGTGLGLATVYGIVKQNDGSIDLVSEPGSGTTVRIHLPRHTGQPAESTPAHESTPTGGNGETLLVVEDDPAILKLARAMLEALGYVVLTALDPYEAIRQAERHDGDIDLLVTDVVMPEMNGRELSEQLQSGRPGLKTLFMSGYTADVIAHRGVLEGGVHFMAKPFTKTVLARKVKEALE